MIKVVLLDDEVHSTKVLSSMISNSAIEGFEVVGAFNDVDEAHTYLQFNPCDVLFLDIEMPKLSGFEFLTRLWGNGIKPKVIFVTAYDEYALSAFKFSANDFLLKPAMQDDIDESLHKVKNDHTATVPAQIEYLKAIIKENKVIDRIILSVHDGYEIIEVSHIVYVEADSNYSFVHIKNQKPIHISRTLKEFENTLGSHGFLRVHNSFLINTSEIRKFIKTNGGFVAMSDGKEVPVSKTKKLELIEYFNNLLK